jgi:hypothetical protein
MAIAVFTGFFQLCDNSGDPLNGGSVTVYQAGTTTPIQLYNDDDLAGGQETTNPITLDSAGRHAITYFSTQSYKVLVKNSSGSTIYTVDNIDPGIPVGSGALAIANGGTGATSAGAALSNLGGATAAELADVAADVAALSGAAASTEKTHLATGTTAQRPGSPAAGDVRRNTDLSTYEGYDGSNWVNFVVMPTAATDPSATDSQEGLIELAVQTEMETATDVARAVTPGRQKYHPGHPKLHFRADAAGAIVGVSGTDYVNMTSVTDTAVGIIDCTIATDFANTNYNIVVGTVLSGSSNTSCSLDTSSGFAAGTFRMRGVNEGTSGAADPTNYAAVGFGDQA